MEQSQRIKFDEIETRLQALVSVPAISGFERESKLPDIICELLERYSPEIDSLGNVFMRVGSGGKKILVEAHLDEVGFIKTANGFVTVGSIGENQINNLVVGDDGRISYFRRNFEVNGSLVRSPALDNRTGCTALTFLPDLLKDVNAEVYIAFTTREETTKEGILRVYKKYSPEIVISVDSAYASPYDQRRWQVPECGNGPAIQIQGPNFFINEYSLIEKIAKRAGIPYQFEIVDSEKGGTNMDALVGEEIRRFQVNIPVRYQHTNMSETDLRDIKEAILLVSALVKELC